MIKLIKLQIRNVFHNKLFYICLLISVLMSPILLFVTTSALKMGINTQVWPQITDFFNSELSIVTILFVVLFSVFDFSEGTTKNIVARGYTRSKLLFSKYVAILIGLLIIYFVTIIAMFILYGKNGLGYNSTIPLILVNSFVSIISTTVFYSTLSFLLEKTSTAIIVSLFAPNIISVALGFADNHLPIKISEYWLFGLSSKFVEHPSLANLAFPFIMNIGYAIGIYLLGVYILKNREIK